MVQLLQVFHPPPFAILFRWDLKFHGPINHYQLYPSKTDLLERAFNNMIHPPNQPTYSKDDMGAIQLYQNPHVTPPSLTLPCGYTFTDVRSDLGCRSLGSDCWNPLVQVMELDISGNNLGPEGAKAQQMVGKKWGFPTAERPSRRYFLGFKIPQLLGRWRSPPWCWGYSGKNTKVLEILTDSMTMNTRT